jgi:AcrR family transcriptional regulator
MKRRTYTMTDRADSVAETRQRVVVAARALFAERWYDDVTLGQIADAAGVSHQTVLNHFTSKEGVFSAVLAFVEAEVVERDSRSAHGDTDTAVRMLLERYEESGLENARFVVQEQRSPLLHETLERARAQHREWVEQTFAHCLPSTPGPGRRRKIAAFVVATEVMAWKAVRHDYGFSKADTIAAMAAVIKGIEGQP